MKKRNSFHEDKYLFSQQKIFFFMKIIRQAWSQLVYVATFNYFCNHRKE